MATLERSPVVVERPELRRKGFESLDHEAAFYALPVSGEIPRWVAGSLLRTGPAKWEFGEKRLAHLIDGMAMLHRFSFADGRVSYASRFLRSKAYRAAEGGRFDFYEFATDPCRRRFKRLQTLFAPNSTPTDNGNVNLTRLGERFIAMTEAPLPVEFDPQTLEAAGVAYAAPGHLSSAHPHRDRASGDLLSYAIKLGRRESEYRFFAIGAEREPRIFATVPSREPAYLHSFGLTPHYLILAEFPFVIEPMAFILHSRPYIDNYRWEPGRGTRFTVLSRTTGQTVAEMTGPASFGFHHVNAYEEDDLLVVDVSVYADAGVVQDTYIDALRTGTVVRPPQLRRFRLDLRRGEVDDEQLAEIPFEMPQINWARSCEYPYRYAWGVTGGGGGWFEMVAKIDVEDREALIWGEEGCFAGEPIFVASPDAEAEDDGVVLSVVLDGNRDSSFLLVLDAASLEEIGRAEVPHHIPFGFHGQYAPGAGLGD